jgi:plasmid stabilization system protein ParE
MSSSDVDALARPKSGQSDIVFFMTKVLKEAIAEVSTLPESDQELIGRELLAHVEKLRSLRSDIAHGARSLDAGKGRELDIEDVISRARGRYMRRGERAIVWSPEAGEDLLAIWIHVARDASPDVADEQLRSVERACEALAEWPHSGRARDELFQVYFNPLPIRLAA